MGVAGQIIENANDVAEAIGSTADFVTNGAKTVGKLAGPFLKAALPETSTIADKAFKSAEAAHGVAEGVEKAEVPLAVALGAAKTGYQIYKGDYKGASATYGGTAVAMAGSMAGAEIGAVVGTAILPVVGTAIGGIAGGIVGGIAGYAAGSELGKKAYDVAKEATFIAGAKAGAAKGTAILPLPVVGTVIGGIVGGIATYAADSELGKKAHDVVRDGAIGARGGLSKVYNCFASGNTPPQVNPAAAPVMSADNISPQTQKVCAPA